MEPIAIFILLFIAAIALDVPMWILLLTQGSIALMGFAVYKLFDKERG